MTNADAIDIAARVFDVLTTNHVSFLESKLTGSIANAAMKAIIAKV